MANPPKTIGKLGNVAIAGIGWETTQIFHSSADLTSGERLIAAPSLYSRRNQISSLDISCDTASTLITFSGNNTSSSLSILMPANDHRHIEFTDPLTFPTGIATNIATNQAANVYVTAKYFVE